ncbi:unnamed protein product [Lactuca saligna]|uniref:PGG domain-containing protein n=1 Tax=Lactuca saligna TaxID=75948 RepID=A0AA35VE61_LACSI|nr:unnamed protein product [Lactuca saligna]
MELLRIIWGHIMKLSKTKIDDMVRGHPDQITDDKYYSSDVLFVAAEMGNTAFIVELIRQYPEQVLALNDNKQSIFHVAVTHRYRGIYSLLHVLGSMKESIIDLEDENGNNMLHLVGILSKTTRSDYLLKDIPGPAAQLITDLAWFKSVCAMLPPSLREKKNKAGIRPRELFNENHKELVARGVEWTKKISSELMVVAALIATISFAACITFVGGYNQDTGKPVFTDNKHLNSILLSNGVSFILASTSIFCFLSIISSHYTETALFRVLFIKLAFAMTFLAESIIFVIAAFSYNFILLFPKKYIQSQYLLTTLSYMVSFLFLYWLIGRQYWFLATIILDDKFLPPKRILF